MSDAACGLLQILASALAAAAAAALAAALSRGRVKVSWRLPDPVALLAAVNERCVPRAWLDTARAALRKAGRPRQLGPAELMAMAEICAAGFLIGGIGLTAWLALPPYVPLGCAALGAAYPAIWVRDKAKARQREIVRALPFDLDLLTLSVEAGLDFAAALAKVVEKGRRGPLADELSIALKELKLGKTREEALRNLAARAGVPTLTSFVQALIQADRMGTPLGKVLRTLSTQMRVERSHRAEKLANEAPVKLLFPLICFILPTLFLMLFGPVAHQMFFSGTF